MGNQADLDSDGQRGATVPVVQRGQGRFVEAAASQSPGLVTVLSV
jgi:hypothetical protein